MRGGRPAEAVVWLTAGVAGLLGFRLALDWAHGHGEAEELIVLSAVAYMIVVSGQLAHILGLPAAIVEILAGIGLATAAGGPVGESKALEILAGIGAFLVLFMAGTEVDVSLIRKRFRSALELALLSLAGSALVGFLVARSSGLGEHGVILVIAGLSATSAALTYAILATAGLLRGRRGQVALAAAMITDVVGMLLLNVATSEANPLILLYGVIIIAAILIQPLLPRLAERPFESELRLIIMAVIVLGSLSELIGVHGVLTTFILGVVVSEIVQSRRVLREKLEGLATGFLTPFFFVASGMSVDPGTLAALAPIVVVSGLGAFAAKFFPALIYARLRGWGRRAPVYAASISPLLTVTIIAAQVGLSSGIITEEVYAILTGSVVATSLAASLVALAYLGRHIEGRGPVGG